MIFLIVDNNKRVVYEHHKPFDLVAGLGKTQEELEKEGVLVDSIPESENNGKTPILHCNPKTKELWYEYEEIPLTPEEELELLKQQVLAQQTIINLLLGV